MERLRILRVIARTNVGGPALQVATLMAGLDRDRFDQRLVVGSVDPTEADYLTLRASGIETVRIPSLGRAVRPTDDVRAFAALAREIRRVRPHIVHTHTAKAGVLGRVAARTAHVPSVVHTFHGHLLHGYFSPAKTRAVVTVERALARATTRLAAVGAQVRDDLLAAKIGTLDKYVVIPPGVPQPPVQEPHAARALVGAPLDCPVVAFVARMTSIKRPDRFADVVARVVKARPNTQFVVAGDGALLADLRERCTKFEDNVRFLGWWSDVGAVYSAADAVLLTSDNEGMPVSLIEAAMCGVPAVATDVGSTREVVVDGETGIVTSTSPHELAIALVRLLDDTECRTKMGKAAARRAQEKFSAARLVRDTEALYTEVTRARCTD
jgi:glycosyltransferase involved in cell wall biosynthesis